MLYVESCRLMQTQVEHQRQSSGNETADALRRNEFYLSEGQRLAHMGSWAFNPSGFFDYWSQELFRIYGLDPHQGAPTLERYLATVHPQDRDFMSNTIKTMHAERSGCDVKKRIVRPDGELRYIRCVGIPVVEGEVLKGFLGTAIDITEQELLTQGSERRQAYLAEAQSLIHTGSWAWNVGTDERFWSEETFRIFEIDPVKLKPAWHLILDRVHPDDRASLLRRKKMESTQTEWAESEADFRIVVADGKIKHLHSIAHPVMDASGQIIEVIGTVMDVTERKRAAGLRDGESRILEMIARDASLQEILENLVRVIEAQFAGLLCSVLLLDEDGQHARHGAAPSLPKDYSKAIDGLRIGPKAGSCGTAMYRREPVVVTDILQDPLWEAYRSVAEPYGFRACWSTPILAPSGKALGSFAMYYPEPSSPSSAETHALGMATHLAGIAIERKLAREERERLRQAQADLAHINRVTTMGELTASLAHEIKQPTTAALINAKTCLRWLGRDDPDISEAREAASRMVKDVTRAADIIGRISLPFKKGALQWELVDVNELVREMIALLRSEANRYSISIRTELAEDLPKVMADRVQLQQVFMNLMLNGIDAMKEMSGGSELIIKSEADDGQLLISVSDTGVGLPPEQADQIFRAFFTTKDKGTGMGLPISRSIIESHGGRLWAPRAFGRGATFQFTLPATVAAHA